MSKENNRVTINGEKIKKMYLAKDKDKLSGRQVCCNCGEPLVTFNPKTGEMESKPYFIVIFESGIKLPRCENRQRCKERKWRKRRRRKERGYE